MTKLEKRSFAETAYKRMWQIGYKGRFGAFFWPTFYGPSPDSLNFNGSEHRAWESSDALLDLLQQLNEKYRGRVSMMAHSMGNVVASEALHKASGVVVKNYVASQAALPADVFRLNPDITETWWAALTDALIGYGIPILPPKEVTTPNVYAYYYPDSRDVKYCSHEFPEIGKPFMSGIGGAANWHNYMNSDDWALDLWIYNQSQKPTTKVFTYLPDTRMDYSYRYFLVPKTWGFWADESGTVNDHGLYFGERDRSPDSTYEIFSYCAQARCQPTGRQGNVGGPFSTGKQLNFTEFGSLHPGHSAQFLSSICQRWIYWSKLLKDCDIKQFETTSNYLQ